MRSIKEKIQCSNIITISHVYRELDTEADSLAKDAVTTDPGILHINTFDGRISFTLTRTLL